MTTLLPKREYKYEALRLFSMPLIIGAHYLSCDNLAIHTQKELQHSWPSCFHNSLVMFGQVGVCLFVLISDYFLSLKNCFSSRRVLKLWIRVEAYSVGLLLLYIVLAHFQAVGAADLHSVTLRTVMISFFPVLGGAYWFISAFFVVTIASSFLNKMLNQLTSQDTISVLFLLIFVTFVWKLINPNTAYYSDVAYLFSVYVTGYCIRRFEDQIPKIGLLQCLFGVIGCFFCVLLGTKLFTSNFSFVNEWGYSSYLLIAGAGASPLFSFFAAVCIFIFVQKADKISAFHRIGHNYLVKKCIDVFAPATLGVYLIHENMFIKQLIWSMVFASSEPSGLFYKVVVATISVALLYMGLLVVSHLFDKYIVKPISDHAFARFGV